MVSSPAQGAQSTERATVIGLLSSTLLQLHSQVARSVRIEETQIHCYSNNCI